MKVGREMKIFSGATREELQLKVRLAYKEYVTMGFSPQMSAPALRHNARELDPGFVLRPRPELNPTIYQGRVSFYTWVGQTRFSLDNEIEFLHWI